MAKLITLDNNNLIVAAVSHLRQPAVERANKEAHATVDHVRADLEASGWDLNVAMKKFEMVQVRNARKALYLKMVTTDHGKGDRYGFSRNAPHFVKMNDKLISKFIAQAEADAALQYDAFVVKLVSKIGEVTEANLDGDHVWHESRLTVIKADGSKEVWKTQMILNCSPLGNLFNQWPTVEVWKKNQAAAEKRAAKEAEKAAKKQEKDAEKARKAQEKAAAKEAEKARKKQEKDALKAAKPKKTTVKKAK